MTLREHTAPLNMEMPIGSPWVLLLLLHSRSVLESVEASDATGAGESIACKTHSLPQPTYISHTPDFRSPSILNLKHLNNDSKLFSDNCTIGKYLTTVPFSSFNLYSNHCSLPPTFITFGTRFILANLPILSARTYRTRLLYVI